MFRHIFKYRFLSFLRARQETFWTALFPLILGTCFMVAFSGIESKAYTFHTIPVAVVYETENEIFRTVMSGVASDDSQGEPFLSVTETDDSSALELLNDKKVDGIITVTDTVELTVKQNGINQTALQSFLTQYLQKVELINKLGPAHIQEIFDTKDFITEDSLNKNNVGTMTCYYFSLIGMAALFGGFFGTKCAGQMKADQTPEGLRKCISPAKRNVLIAAEFLASYAIHMCSMIILMLFMTFVLKVDFGNQIGYVLLTCAAGSLVGIASGMFVGSIPKLKEGIRVTIFLCYSLGSSFLSGLMVADIKIYLQHHAPIVNMLNPATLIQDSLYSLVIYDTHERFFLNIAVLAGYALVLCVASYFMTRRESYASL